MKKNKVIAAYIIGIVLLVIGIFFDKQISVLIASLRSDFLNTIMSWLSYAGTGFFVMVFMTTLFLWQERKREYIVPLWASFIFSLVIVGIVKTIIFRARPFDVLGIFSLMQESGSSFPSGHTAVVFSAIAILDREFPKFKWFWILFACLVGFSRIYVGAHFLTDVVFSALLGGSIGLFMLKNKKWFDKPRFRK